LSTVEYLRVKSQTTQLEHVEAMTPGEMALSTGSGPVTLRVGFASSGYLSLFGLEPTRGRPFTESEQRDQAPVVVLDGGFWARQFGRDAGMIGRSIDLDGRPFVVIGITDAGYQPQLQKLDAWIPLRAVIEPGRGGGPRNLIAAARLGAGAAPDRAAQELRAIEASVAKEFPDTHARAALVFLNLREALYGSYQSIPPAVVRRGRRPVADCLLERRQPDPGASRRARGRRVAAAIARCLSVAHRSLSTYRERVSHAGGVVIGGLLSWAAVTAVLGIDPDVLPADARSRISPAGGAAMALVFVVTSAVAGLLPAYRAAATSARSVVVQASARQIGRRRGPPPA
jgi:hypothetical protein